MRLALNTADGSSKRDVLLELESMPVPVKILPGHYSVDVVIIEDPMTWANLRGNKGHAAFDTVADIRTLAEMIQERKAARKCLALSTNFDLAYIRSYGNLMNIM
jgi:hypothetical protein